MASRWVLLLCLIGSLSTAGLASGTTTDLSRAIDGFVAKQFPRASSHVWVVNGAQWQAENEVVVDLNTVVTERPGQVPTEGRFLLLIVKGKVAASQRLPLNAQTDCQGEPA
ncbi:MAG: hypothetical protein AB1411_08855 [Nitrospirota bacterium]